MEIKLKAATIKEIGPDVLTKWGVTNDELRWGRSVEIDLSKYTKTKVQELKSALLKHKHVRGIPPRLLDIEQWLSILNGEKVRCRQISKFAPLLKQYLKSVPRHWVYERTDGGSGTSQPYYVGGIEYVKEHTSHGCYYPAVVIVSLYYEEMGIIKLKRVEFQGKDCIDLTIGKALAMQGFMTETPELLESYLTNRKKYLSIIGKVGLQFLAEGVATLKTKDDDEDYYWNIKKINLDREGQPAHVVIDVIREGDKEEDRRNRNKEFDPKFWLREGCDFDGGEDDDDNDIRPGDEEEDVTPTVEIPLKPTVMCFDLKRHARLQIHVDQLTEYQYVDNLDSKLVLPEEVTNLVSMLVNHKGGFKDIVGNKGGGAIILCAGPPGTGKTLTAEVYSEAMKRPLYSVQCSQLGLSPDDLEKELVRVFSRAQRWNAILLLDEADVYVAARGSDLQQNAIVGVFLRVLEYYSGVLFLTTNRSDLVDDAIASRCLARINYTVPTIDNQKRIWRTLADTAGISLKQSELEKIVGEFNNLSGRDIKNLLKLASMVAAADGADGISAKIVSFVKQFKPTNDPVIVGGPGGNHIHR